MYTPIFDSFDENRKKLVALVESGIVWRTYFTDILPDNARGVIVVLENTCGQEFTYIINGRNASYVGPGDLHDPNYDDHEYKTGFGAFLGLVPEDMENIPGECFYGLRVYPSQETEDGYLTPMPWIFTCTLLAVFLFTSLVFITYDWIVERRQKLVLKSATQSGAIVSSLFPKNVREQMYATNENQEAKAKAAGEFRREVSTVEGASPLAQLYPECSVFFADIAGFTKWCSERTPTEVFTLLETIYGAFDKIARKKRVFKVSWSTIAAYSSVATFASCADNNESLSLSTRLKQLATVTSQSLAYPILSQTMPS